jgi:hypothetical protein
MSAALRGAGLGLLALLAGCSFSTTLATPTPRWSLDVSGLGVKAPTAQAEPTPTVDDLITPLRYEDLPQSKAVCVVLAGDSWSFFDAVYHATERRIADLYPGCRVAISYKTTPDPDTALEVPLVIPGTRAEQWAARPNLAGLTAAVKQYRNADVVVLYLGGNDLLKVYNCRDIAGAHCDRGVAACDLPPAERPHTLREVVEPIGANVETIVDALLAVRPGLKVVIVGYAKPNMKESLDSSGNRRRWIGIGCPAEVELNTAVAELALRMQAVAARRERVYYIRNLELFARGAEHGTPARYMINAELSVLGLSRSFVDSIHLGKPAQYQVADRTALTIYCKDLIQPHEDSPLPFQPHKPCNDALLEAIR